MPEIVQEIGAYAGLASVVGLAVLSVLYFSQARDVRRLREWAGRAPERADQGTVVTEATPGRVVAQPQTRQSQPQARPAAPATSKAPPVPAGAGPRPAPAPAAAAQGRQAQPAAAPAAAGATAAAATAAKPATAAAATAAKPATAAAQDGPKSTPAPPQPGSPEQAPAAASTALKQGTPPPAQPQTAAPGSGQTAAAPAGGQRPPSAAPANTSAPPVPGAPRSPAPPARPVPSGRPAPQPTQVIPPNRESWHQRIFGSTRNLILAIAGVLLLGAGVALALTQLSGEESDPPAGQAQGQQPVAGNGGDDAENGEGRRRDRPAIDPSAVTVAVLNGTTVPGLAARVSDEVQSAGFEVGTVANSSDQQRAESVILFAPGHEREAAAVSRRLDIAQREPIDAATQGLAGDATVVVVTGADRS